MTLTSLPALPNVRPQLDCLLCDLGNVILFFSHARMCDQIAALYGSSSEVVRAELFQSHLLGEFERGRLTETQMQSALAAKFGRAVDEADLRRAASDIFTVNESLLPVLDVLKGQGLRLVLLSNTSISHITWIREHYPVLDRFDELVLSYKTGFAKPEDGIYLAALQAIRCPPERCLYLDDIAEYVEKGKTFGLRGHVFTTTETFVEPLRGEEGRETRV